MDRAGEWDTSSDDEARDAKALSFTPVSDFEVRARICVFVVRARICVFVVLARIYVFVMHARICVCAEIVRRATLGGLFMPLASLCTCLHQCAPFAFQAPDV